jgi:hypothetical protein
MSRTRALVATMARWSLRLAGAAVLLLVFLAALGATYQAFATRRDAARLPAPGRLVDVGGHRLHLDCQGAAGARPRARPRSTASGSTCTASWPRSRRRAGRSWWRGADT